MAGARIYAVYMPYLVFAIHKAPVKMTSATDFRIDLKLYNLCNVRFNNTDALFFRPTSEITDSELCPVRFGELSDAS